MIFHEVPLDSQDHTTWEEISLCRSPVVGMAMALGSKRNQSGHEISRPQGQAS